MPKTILVADDNDDLRALMVYQFRARGYHVLVASDGDQAVEKCRTEKPDLILLDILMPGKDGTEAAAVLKSDPATRHIPIIFLTSLLQSDESAKMDAVTDSIILPKSTEVNELIRKIEEVLNKK